MFSLGGFVPLFVQLRDLTATVCDRAQAEGVVGSGVRRVGCLKQGQPGCCSKVHSTQNPLGQLHFAVQWSLE